MDLQSLLGDDAEYLLSHTCKGIPREQLTAPGPDFLDRVFVATDRSPQVVRGLGSLYGHGRLAGSTTAPRGADPMPYIEALRASAEVVAAPVAPSRTLRAAS